MRPSGKRHQTIPVPLGGEFTAGDPTMIPDGTLSSVRNYSIRPSGGGIRLDCRAPFVYDSLDTVSGYAVWLDLVNEVAHTVAVRSADQKLYTKTTGGNGWGAGVTGIPSSTRLTAYTNFLGKLYMMFDNGAGVPSAAASWDGTTVVTSPFNIAIFSRDIESFIDRLFFVNPRVTFTNFLGASTAYDWVGVAQITKTSCTVSNVVSSGTTIGRVFVTATSGAKIELRGANLSIGFSGVATVAASGSSTPMIWRQDLRGVSGSYSMPVKFEIYLVTPWSNNTGVGTPWVAGDLISDGTNLQRCTTAGTGGTGSAPTWATTVGATTTDGTAVWTLEQLGSTVGLFDNTYVPPVQSSGQWTTYYTAGAVPATTNLQRVALRLSFGNTASPTVTLAAVDISLKDGLADGDPRKKNYGAQLTQGDFYYPFFNQESSATATQNIDAVMWSEINNPQQILAKNTYALTEIAGLATAAVVANGRLVVFKRKGMWIFRGVADVNEPILPETNAIAIGCLGPQSLDLASDGTLYWISSEHICKMSIGSDSTPSFIDDPGMFEEIMAHGTNWVETQSTYNLPILAIDKTNSDVWIYTQKGKIYVYNIPSQQWSYFDTNPTGTASEVQAMIYSPVGSTAANGQSGSMLVSFGGASATRFDSTSDAQDTIVTGGGTAWNIASDIIPRPFELFAPRYEASVLELGLYHIATLQQGSLSISYSFDRGSTYTTPSGYPVTTYLSNPRIRLPLAATGPSVTIKISRTGAGGRRNWAISKADALLRVHRGELTYTNAT